MKSFLVTVSLTGIAVLAQAQNQMPVDGKFQLLPLPYATTALEPYIGKQTVETHWGKHVQTYINNVNTMIEGTPFKGQSLTDIVKQAEGGLYNNAAQVWNHNMFFALLSAEPKKAPTGELAEAINKSFGSFDAFKEAFTKAGTTLFGSGWVWLLKKADGSLEIKQTPNGNCPVKEGKPVINLDVWEHAYYLDYQNRRADFIAAFWNLLDWSAAEHYYTAK